MKKLLMVLALLPLMAAAETWTDPSTGIEWIYTQQSDGSVSLGGGVWDCPAISKSTTGDLTIPSVINGRAVTSIGEDAFYGCSGLKTVYVGNDGDIDAVKQMLQESGFDIDDVTFDYVEEPECAYTWEYDAYPDEDLAVLWGCKIGADASGDIVIPDSLGGCRHIIFGEDSFDGRTDITSVTLSAAVRNSEDTPIGYAFFSGCLNLSKFDVAESSTSFLAKDGVLYSKDGKRLVCCPETFASFRIPLGVVVIDSAAFAGCTRLSSITIPSSVTNIGHQAFSGCKGLESITIPSSVVGIGMYAFDDCSSLKTVHVGKDGDIDVVKQMLRESEFAIDGVTFDYAGRDTIVPGESVSIDTGLIGYTASGLPSGLRYDKTTGMITGAATRPTAAEGVIVKFTKSGEPDAERTIVVGPLPTIGVALVGDTDGCKVTGAGAYLVGKRVTLKVTTKKGTAFLGWAAAGDGGSTGELLSRETTYSFTMGKEDVSLVAKFEKEKMSVGCTGLSDGSFTAGVAGSPEGIPLEIETQSGIKSVKVEKLPAGMKYDAKKERIIGAPTKAGDNTVVITVTAVSGAVEKKEIKVLVASMPETAVGTFNGFVANGEQRIGTFALTTTDAGKLTAKVITDGGTVSFSGTCWDSAEGGIYRATLTSKKGEFMTLALDSNAAWNADQLTGTYSPPNMSGWFALSAQRNAFGKTWYFTAVGNERTGWTFAYTKDAKAAALTVTLKADGSTAVAGTLPNGFDEKDKPVALKVSASGYANVGRMTAGAIIADFAPIITVNKVKKVLSIHANLWFDRSDDHAEGVGGAEFSE